MPQDTPRYRQIAAELRAAINRGEYPPGARLPGENALMQDYGVARMTARQALAVLIGEGLAVSGKGAGVFVRTFRPIIRNGIARLAAEGWASGKSIWSADTEDRALTVDQIRVDEVTPPDHVAVALELEPTETVIQRSRRFILDGKPVLLSVSYLPSKVAKGTPIAEENTGPGGIYARLSDLGLPPVRFREDLRARMPNEAETVRLALDPATPVIDIARIAYTETGQPVELNEMTADAASYISATASTHNPRHVKQADCHRLKSLISVGASGACARAHMWTPIRICPVVVTKPAPTAITESERSRCSWHRQYAPNADYSRLTAKADRANGRAQIVRLWTPHRPESASRRCDSSGRWLGSARYRPRRSGDDLGADEPADA